MASVVARSFPTLIADAWGTDFAYQGRLKAGGTPANGMRDRRFSLHDVVAREIFRQRTTGVSEGDRFLVDK